MMQAPKDVSLPDSGNPKLLTVYSTRDRSGVADAVLYLQDEEIPHAVRDSDPANEFDPTVELLVSEEDAARAIAVLDRWDYLWMDGLTRDKDTIPNQLGVGAYLAVLFLLPFLTRRGSLLLFCMALVGTDALVWMLGHAYLRRLRRLGYEGLDARAAFNIRWSCMGHAHNLPPASDVAVLPGYRNDSEHIVNFILNMEAYKRAARGRRGRGGS